MQKPRNPQAANNPKPLRDAEQARVRVEFVVLAGVAAVAGLLAWEHRLVRADDLSRIDAAFFTMNGYVSVIFFAFWAADIFLA